MGILFVVFALSMAIATFLENDYGSPAAYSMVYGTKWFELILLLLIVNLVGQVIALKLLRKGKLTVALFHLSFIIMIAGAGITRYFGWEGSIHIREGEEQVQCFSTEKYIGYSVNDNQGNIITDDSQKYSLTSVSADNYDESIKINGREYELILAKIIPNASETLIDAAEGSAIVSLIVTKSMSEKETLILQHGELKTSNGYSFGFAAPDSADINISVDSGKFFIQSRFDLGEMSMMSQAVTSVEKGKPLEMKNMQVLSLGDIKIVPQQMSLAGAVRAVAVKPDQEATGMNAFIFHLA